MNEVALKRYLKKNATFFSSYKRVEVWVTPAAKKSAAITAKLKHESSDIIDKLVEAFNDSVNISSRGSPPLRVVEVELAGLVAWACRPSGTTYLLVTERKNPERPWQEEMMQALSEPPEE